jgi:hypothetical protein
MLSSRDSRAAMLGVAAVVVIVGQASGQDTTSCQCGARAPRPPSELELRSTGGISFIQSRPIGAFARNVGFGYGASGAYFLRLDHEGFLSLRTDAGVIDYGHESKRVPLSPTIGGRIQVTVVTSNYIVPVSVGPQVAWPRGFVRPYVNAGVSAQFFFTDSRVDGSDGELDFASTTNQHDWTPAWVAGGGVLVPLAERSVKVLLDAGVQWYGGGHARYLRPGSIQDLPNSQILINPLDSDTHMALVRIGVRIGR